MRYIWVVVFNVLGIYILISFFFSKGGIIDSFRKMETISRLKEQILNLEIEIEDLKYKLAQLKAIENDERQILLSQGKKKGETVIFKFVEKKGEESVEKETEKYEYENLVFRFYFSLILIALMIITGNLFIYFKLKKRGT